jgi:hypothetical protein
MWYDTFNGQFWVMIAGMVFVFCGILAKSKCTRFECCGIVIERDVRAEVDLEKAQIRGLARNPTMSPQPVSPRRNMSVDLYAVYPTVPSP